MLNDVHCHFFSATFFAALARQVGGVLNVIAVLLVPATLLAVRLASRRESD